MTREERWQRNERARQEYWNEEYRRAKGIPPREWRPTGWVMDYIAIWGKPPGEPLTPEEFLEREPLWNRWVAKSSK